MSLIILGIDPGSRCTGVGVLEIQRQQVTALHNEVIQAGQGEIAPRLIRIYERITEVIEAFKPTEAAIEEVFSHHNPRGALVLGQARGVALLALAQAELDKLAEYSARRVKQAVVGYGAATKEQVQFMIQKILNLESTAGFDATDALAIALCHHHSRLRPEQWQRRNGRSRRSGLRRLPVRGITA